MAPKPQNTIFLCEHFPVYTMGIRSKVPPGEIDRLKELGAEFHFTDRGGLITFHGPGQLMCYPVLDLGSFRRSVRWYVGSLEETVVRTCKELGVSAGTTCNTGVWVGNNKIAALGIHVSKWITSHGIALNCNSDLEWFDHIIPCGLVGKGVTSLSKETNRNVTVSEAAGKFLQSFSDVFQCEVKTGD
ncbi:predicted protein [Nematostella vectensis]|uniref:Octanoyl-[acyl-carrier-protein]:protein N-octanoyltransferase LIPT2, mitochondrial n=1 Tax=Nematostella vectensis TaxID=45351 RepID=A7SZM1_NEMVE|nr:predicted protein [Nematostella vectensis]|eukprot:XP_001622930.1 predicted protein [Nematostella vectensis]